VNEFCGRRWKLRKKSKIGNWKLILKDGLKMNDKASVKMKVGKPLELEAVNFIGP
jgi:hypothetical protein